MIAVGCPEQAPGALIDGQFSAVEACEVNGFGARNVNPGKGAVGLNLAEIPSFGESAEDMLGVDWGGTVCPIKGVVVMNDPVMGANESSGFTTGAERVGIVGGFGAGCGIAGMGE